MTLAIYCAGGLGKELIDLARSVSRWDDIFFVDDITEESEHAGAKVYRFDEISHFNDVEFIIANGEPLVRETLYKKIKAAGYSLATIYGSGCCVLPGAQIGEGCILTDCIVSADVVIKPNVLIQTKAAIGHDAVIGENSIISAFCFIGGFTQIGKNVYMGPGALAKDRIRVGESAIISLGAVLHRNVKNKAIMVGNPAKRMGENTKGSVFNLFS
ncbi:MAG: acetyltransferase [Schwartzia succinivorans]|jgi:sugar O-acyltransferase (sialic acid O-acetyltransferase NeuD family)|uniref:acetyltransferase n=1 Tax=Schwartzia succinivorans TaxID=55507 RepID=UPI0023531527|nr:acetyltransferase [Schwartzia succinivorans]MBE6096542.1 acetyltransferase [Schwartzia succinivorans]